MRASQYFFITDRNVPADAELISHQLMLRSGMIRKVAGGVYTWLPLGLRVVRKVEQVVREEMNRAGALELMMPAMQPAELWRSSGRWEKYGPELMRLKDRHQRDFCLGPTHEEVITTLAANDINSYRQLPINFYQIQTKFRDEVRPRFGVMRGREFIMKDAYSFHATLDCLEQTYQTMYQAYTRIFTRLGLKFRAVAADTGAIGGNHSHEFQVLADAGEDLIAFCPNSDYAANIELCALPDPQTMRSSPTQACTMIATPNTTDCDAVSTFLKVPLSKIIKTLLVETHDGQHVVVLLRGDHSLNLIKLRKILNTDEVLMANEESIKALFHCPSGFLGPINAPSELRVIADFAVQSMSDAVCGANKIHQHYQGVNIGRDCAQPSYFDLRSAMEGDPSPDGKGKLSIRRGIEVGHIFQLRSKYSATMNAFFQNAEGKKQAFEMGCYGIGITRIVAAAVEQSAFLSPEGKPPILTLPMPLAPFHVYIAPMGYHKSELVKLVTEQVYDDLNTSGIEVYLDDRNERAGVMFSDHELSGVPIRLVFSDKHLANGMVECLHRRAGMPTSETMLVPMEKIKTWVVDEIRQALQG